VNEAALHLVDRDSPPLAAAAVSMQRVPAGRESVVLALGDGPHVDWLGRSGVPFEIVPLRGRSEPLRSLVLGRRLSGLLASSTADAPANVIAHSPRAAVCATVASLPRRLARRFRLRVEVYRQPHHRAMGWLIRCCRWFDLRLVAHSQTLARLAIDAGFPSDRVEYSPPAVTLSACREDRAAVRATLNLASDGAPVLLAGGWTLRRDRQELALWAGAILSMLDSKIRVIVPGDTEQRDVLAEWIGQAGYGQIAVWPERRFDWPALMAAADVFIHAGAVGTARAGRATGAENLEADPTPMWWAMLAGVPIVAMDGPGARELLADGRTALLCPTERPRDLAMRIRQLLIDKPLADRLTAQARYDAVNRLTADLRKSEIPLPAIELLPGSSV
jgi:glycosyltransferase involved in cell wall biosynthesis